MKTPCVACGLRDGELSLCFQCIRLRDEDFPVRLGLSIRRFLRRAEVHQLREDICMGVYSIAMQNYHYGAGTPRNERLRDESELFRTALSRLATLALEGHGDG